MKRSAVRLLIQLTGITVGALIFGISYSWFLVPYKIAPGGVGGLGQILFHLFGLPISISMLLFNIPLLILGAVVIGRGFGIRTIYGSVITAVMSDLVSLPSLYKLGIIRDISRFTFSTGGSAVCAFLPPEEIYLSAIVGSVLLGIGLGIIFRFRGSTGGTDIPVAILKEKTGISIGGGYWLVESFIIVAVGLAFRDPKIVIWGYINLFLSAKVTDVIAEGLPYLKGMYIISEKEDEIKKTIFSQIGRGVTIFYGEGGYTGKEQRNLFCVLNRKEVAIARDIIRDIDPAAFVVFTDVYDVMGYGFKPRSLEFTERKKKTREPKV